MIDRISGRDSFRRFDGAPRSRSGPLTVVAADPIGARPALAFAVSRRVGNAVVRNRVRRRVREAARELARQGQLEPRAYLVVAHPSAARAGYGELSSALRRAVAKLRER